jgi:hypothetical protein
MVTWCTAGSIQVTARRTGLLSEPFRKAQAASPLVPGQNTLSEAAPSPSTPKYVVPHAFISRPYLHMEAGPSPCQQYLVQHVVPPVIIP